MGLINALHEYRGTPDNEFVQRVLLTLIEYTKKHFVLEEKLMRKMNFPDFEKHKAQHRSFLRKVQGYQRQFQKGEVNLTDKILDFLRMWLSSHILIHDKAYQRFMKENHMYT